MGFLISKARVAFTRLRQAFIKAPILQYFDLKYYIWIETDALGYAISGVLSQLTSDQVISDQVTSNPKWHPVAYFWRQMIPVEIRYKTHDGKILAIIEAFKTWPHYLKDCKHEVFVLMDHNNLRQFMDTKSLSF